MGKKVATKVPVAKVVWQWTENVSPENITVDHLYTVYRLRLGKCKTCRKNCSGNPLCLRGLGESVWLSDSKYESILEDNIKDLYSDIRKEDEFIGLKNLGATCYVNTFLQLWFHNIDFRKAVYSYKEDVEDSKFPSTVCGHLQLLFGRLQSSVRKNIDPTPFVKCLGLDTDMQQDAQEFSKLLLNVLNNSTEVGNFLCREFCGEYDYCTKCNTCGTVSQYPSKFYELDLSIQGHKDVCQCLDEFFKEELLTNENQYHCASCDCKRDASRRIVVKDLPRTLNLQLLRFVFDKSTWNKKKLSNFLSFPDTLDMSAFVSSRDAIYDLTAVLIHRGPSASSGHYIAHIKDPITHLWYKFNDESIELMKSGKKLDLDTLTSDDYECDMPKPAKKPKLKKNSHSSKDAYMLVYTKKGSPSASTTPPNLPEIVQRSVEQDNDEFFDIMNSMIAEARKKTGEEIKLHSKMGALLKQMHISEVADLLHDCYWVPTTWLKHMLDMSHTKKQTFDMKKFLCCHGKLNPDKVGGLKCIPCQLAEHLFEICIGETPHVKNETFCLECVEERCFLLRLKASLKDDHTTVTNLLKAAGNASEEGFLIGRSSLRFWKAMALEQMEAKTNENLLESKDQYTNGGEQTKNDEENCESSNEELNFNQDLLCKHGNVTTDTKQYRVVPNLVWDVIIKYFPGAPTYQMTNFHPCKICRDDEFDTAQAAELEKVMVLEQKNRLCNLFHNKNRPCYKNLFGAFINDKAQIFYAVSSEFVSKWRDYIRNPSKHEVVSQVQNKLLLCPHDKLLREPVLSVNYTPEELKESENDNQLSTVLLWPEEWEYITKHFGVDITVSITKHISTPQQCDFTNGEYTQASFSEKLKNVPPDKLCTNGDVCMKDSDNLEVDPSHTGIEDPIYNALPTANIMVVKEENELEPRKVTLKYKPDICQECMLGRQLEKEWHLKHYNNQEIFIRKVISDNKSSMIKVIETPLPPKQQTRKSKRAQTTRGEKKVVVSSDWTLKKLKIHIMQIFFTPPFDQNLWLDGKKLTDDDATLGELSVLAGSTILFVADEPDEKSLEMLPVVAEKQITLEEGFKGTSLLST